MTAKTVQVHLLSQVAYNLTIHHGVPRLAAQWLTFRKAALVADRTAIAGPDAKHIANVLALEWAARNGEAKAEFRSLYNDAGNRVL